MARRRLSPAQIRDRRSKRLVIVLGVVFLAVAGIQGPKLLKQLKHHPPAPTTAPSVAPTTAAGVSAVPAAPTVVATPGAVNASKQLTSFSLLPFKDPFAAPLHGASGINETAAGDDEDAADSTDSGEVAEGETTTKAATQPAETAATPAAATTTTTTTTTTAQPAPAAPTVKFTLPPPNAAVIKTNGNREVVAIGAGFPSAQPMFKLVALAKNKKGIRIGVLGGSFVGGIPTLLLPKGKTITLADQADGTRYVIELLQLTNAVLPAPTQSTTASAAPATTTTTPAATAAPATTTTTPPTTTTSGG